MSQIPGPIEKRDILYGVKKLSATESKKLVGTLESAGWDSDALDFMGHSQDQEGMARLRKAAVEEGNAFLFFKVGRLLGETEAPQAELLRCAQNAEKLGKIRYAIKGYEKLGDQERVDALKAQIATDGDILAEAEQTVFIPENEDEFLEETEEK